MTPTQEPDGAATTAPSSLSSSSPRSLQETPPGTLPQSHGTVLSVRDARCVVPADDGGTRTIFEGINLDITGGSITDITGPSGCGKSTLLTTIARLNPGGSARMSLDGTDSSAIGPQQWRLQVAYVNQRPVLMGETIRQTLLFPWTLAIRKGRDKGRGKNHRRSRGDGAGSERENQTDVVAGRGRASDVQADRDADVPRPTDGQLREALDRAGLADISLDRPVHDVSGGQYARIALLRTLLTRPRVLLADEVDAALDDASDAQIEQLIAEAAKGGMAVVRVRHRASDGLEDRLLRLENSRLTDSTLTVAGAQKAAVPVQTVQRESASTVDSAHDQATAEGGAR